MYGTCVLVGEWVNKCVGYVMGGWVVRLMNGRWVSEWLDGQNERDNNPACRDELRR